MKGKIALEEHFAIPETLQDSAGFVPGDYWKELSARILDIHDRRLREMDAHGIEMMLLSLNAPAVQAIPDIRKASEMARRANDHLANADGFYDVQQKGIQPDWNLRGVFETDVNGEYWFRSAKPRWYPIPDDGPVGKLLAALHRHPNRATSATRSSRDAQNRAAGHPAPRCQGRRARCAADNRRRRASDRRT
jgi:hypothetical protein